jgi:hypothetical protein
VRLARSMGADETPTRERLVQEALARDPAFGGAHSEAGAILLRALGGPTCAEARESCLARLEHHASALEGQGDELGALGLRTKRDLELGLADAAERRLADRCASLRQRAPCLRLRVEAAAATGDRERFSTAAQAYAPHVCASAPACGEAFAWLGEIAGRSGHPGLAAGYFQRAAREAPSSAAWLRAARAAESAGDRARLEAALRHAAQMSGGSAIDRAAGEAPP